MNNRILFLAGNQPGNLGDIMINRGIIKKISTDNLIFIDQGDFTDKEIFELEKINHNVRKCGLFTPKKIIGLLGMILKKKYDVIIHYPGMGSKKSLIIYLIFRIRLSLVYLALRARGYVIIYPNCSWNVSDLTRTVLFIEKIFSLIVHFYGIRDEVVVKYMVNNGLKNIIYTPDVFFLNESFASSKSNAIIIALRDEHKNIYASLNNSEIFKKGLLLVNYFKERFDIYLVCQSKKDVSLMTQLKDNCLDDKNVYFIDYSSSVEYISKYYGKSLYVFSNRLHSLMFSYMSNSIGFAVADMQKDCKLTGMLSTYGFNDLALPIEFSDKDFLTTLENVIKKQKFHLSNINNTVALRKRLLLEVMKLWNI